MIEWQRTKREGQKETWNKETFQTYVCLWTETSVDKPVWYTGNWFHRTACLCAGITCGWGESAKRILSVQMQANHTTRKSCFMKRLHFLPSFLPPTLRPSFLSPPTFLHFVHGPCIWTTPDKAWEGGDGECSLLWSRCFHPRTIAESLPHRMQPWEFPWGAGSQTPRPVFSHHFLPATFPPMLWGTGRWFLGFVSLCATYEWTCIALLFLPFT